LTRLDVLLTPPVPSLKQILWRSGCPPDKAGEEVSRVGLEAVETLKKYSPEAWCGAVLFQPDEAPGFLEGLFPGLQVAVMAATLGGKLDELLHGQADLEAFMLDSAASVAVESYMKMLQLALAELMGMTPTKRLAPGYKGIPLSAQAEIIDMFPASGISCSGEFMLSPVKSMTGAVGWIPQKG